MSKILIIIPAYNEEENIFKTYSSIINHNKKYDTSYDVIVINDGSTDKTAQICKKYCIPTINLLRNLGIGNAVQTGYKYALRYNYDIAVQFDGDGQHNIEFVEKIIKPIQDKSANMVIGSRFVEANSAGFKSSSARRAGINIISLFIKMFTGVKIYDTTSGFRAVDSNLIQLFSDNYPGEFPEPVSTVKTIKNDYKIKETSVIMNERTGGTSSIHSWKKLYFMINVVFSIIIESLGGWKHEY